MSLQESLRYDHHHPFIATLKSKKKLSGKGSERETWHLILRVDESFGYKVGDSVGVLCKNDPLEVENIAKCLSIDPKKIENNNISRCHNNLIKWSMEHGDGRALQRALKDSTKLLPVLELIHIAKLNTLPIDLLPPLFPRFYSIASCPRTHKNEIHLTVILSEYETVLGNRQKGVATNYLLFGLKEDDDVSIYLNPTKHFTLPSKKDLPIIMIGPGTGIAPFRGFLYARKEQNARTNWLFFGERHEAQEFYYQDEMRTFENEGFLKLSTAFSRDQKDKIYVQDVLKRHADEVFDWIEKGAYIYVCGDAKHMAKAVDHTLLEMVKKRYSKNVQDAKNVLKQLRHEKRYVLDVY